jgi:hypothetical protein
MNSLEIEIRKAEVIFRNSQTNLSLCRSYGTCKDKCDGYGIIRTRIKHGAKITRNGVYTRLESHNSSVGISRCFGYNPITD